MSKIKPLSELLFFLGLISFDHKTMPACAHSGGAAFAQGVGANDGIQVE